MDGVLLNKYSSMFPSLKEELEQFSGPYREKLWNDLTHRIMKFLYNKETKGKIDFDFFRDFVGKFDASLNQIKMLKILRMCMHNLSNAEKLTILENLEKSGKVSDQSKLIVQAMKGIVYTEEDISKCLPIMNDLKKQIEGNKDVEQYLYSTYYKLAYLYYKKKQKWRNFFTNALQHLAYTNEEQMNDREKIDVSYEMGQAVIVSKDIYNFSELLEQPLLKSLLKSDYEWVYSLIDIFNRGDVKEYATFKGTVEGKEIFKRNQSKIDEKMEVAALLELVFNLPKNDRVLKFSKIATVCGVPEDRVEIIVMRAIALELIKGSIDQLHKTVTISWVKPKVLEQNRIKVMESKFDQWSHGLQRLTGLLKNRKEQVEV